MQRESCARCPARTLGLACPTQDTQAMTSSHPRPWHAGSLFGDGPRRPLDREQRARFRFLVNAHRRARRLTPHAELVGTALLKRLSIDGRCDPSHDTIAADVGCSARTVRRALDALKRLGLAVWQRRIVRAGWRVAQTSNSYMLVPSANPPPIVPKPSISTGGQVDRETRRIAISTVSAPSTTDLAAAQAALIRRQRAVQEMLLKGKLKRD